MVCAIVFGLGGTMLGKLFSRKGELQRLRQLEENYLKGSAIFDRHQKALRYAIDTIMVLEKELGKYTGATSHISAIIKGESEE